MRCNLDTGTVIEKKVEDWRTDGESVTILGSHGDVNGLSRLSLLDGADPAGKSKAASSCFFVVDCRMLRLFQVIHSVHLRLQTGFALFVDSDCD